MGNKGGRPLGSTKPGLKFLNEDELKRFFIAVDRSKDKRDKFLFRLVFFLGLRVSETAQILLEDINLDSCQISIKAMKNGRDRTYDLDGKMIDKLGQYLKVRSRPRYTKKDNPFLFPSHRYYDQHVTLQQIKGRFKIYAKNANLNPDFSIHSLRHSCGILHAQNNKTPIQIMQWLRHRSVTSTQIYFEQVTFKNQDREAAEMMGDYL